MLRTMRLYFAYFRVTTNTTLLRAGAYEYEFRNLVLLGVWGNR